jgi:YHS domain-containing protein
MPWCCRAGRRTSASTSKSISPWSFSRLVPGGGRSSQPPPRGLRPPPTHPKYSSVQKGHLYYLANADAKKAFDANPEKFTIGLEGWCATGVALGKKLESDPELFVIRGGVTYLFPSAVARKAFEADPAGTLGNPQANWPKLR